MATLRRPIFPRRRLSAPAAAILSAAALSLHPAAGARGSALKPQSSPASLTDIAKRFPWSFVAAKLPIPGLDFLIVAPQAKELRRAAAAQDNFKALAIATARRAFQSGEISESAMRAVESERLSGAIRQRADLMRSLVRSRGVYGKWVESKLRQRARAVGMSKDEGYDLNRVKGVESQQLGRDYAIASRASRFSLGSPRQSAERAAALRVRATARKA